MAYSASESLFQPPPPDILGGLFSLFDPGAWLALLQGTPQINAEAVDVRPFSMDQVNTLIADINGMGLVGDSSDSLFDATELDEAIRQNFQEDNPGALYEIANRVSGKKEYNQAYGGFEATMGPGGQWEQLVSGLTGMMNNPLYSPEQINAIRTQNTEGVISERDRGLEAGREEMAGRGILESGVTADMVTQARSLADKLIREGNINIPIALNKENVEYKLNVQDALTKALGTKSNLDLVRGQLIEGKTPDFSPADLLGSLSEVDTQREALRFFNASQRQQAMKETKEDVQSTFENLMSIFQMKNSNKSSGGSSGSGSFSGGLNLGPVSLGGSF